MQELNVSSEESIEMECFRILMCEHVLPRASRRTLDERSKELSNPEVIEVFERYREPLEKVCRVFLLFLWLFYFPMDFCIIFQMQYSIEYLICNLRKDDCCC